MTIDLSSMQIPPVSVVPEPTAEDIARFERYMTDDLVWLNQAYQGHLIRVSFSLARRCRELEAVVANYESVMDQAKSSARIAELEAESLRLRKCQKCGLTGGPTCSGLICEECRCELEGEVERLRADRDGLARRIKGML